MRADMGGDWTSVGHSDCHAAVQDFNDLNPSPASGLTTLLDMHT